MQKQSQPHHKVHCVDGTKILMSRFAVCDIIFQYLCVNCGFSHKYGDNGVVYAMCVADAVFRTKALCGFFPLLFEFRPFSESSIGIWYWIHIFRETPPRDLWLAYQKNISPAHVFEVFILVLLGNLCRFAGALCFFYAILTYLGLAHVRWWWWQWQKKSIWLGSTNIVWCEMWLLGNYFALLNVISIIALYCLNLITTIYNFQQT